MLSYKVYQIKLLFLQKVLSIPNKKQIVIYIQSTYMMADESTRQREFGNLQAIRNNYLLGRCVCLFYFPLYLISFDKQPCFLIYFFLIVLSVWSTTLSITMPMPT